MHEHLVHLRETAIAGAMPVRNASPTVREAEVLTWAAHGLSDGERLGLSPATVGSTWSMPYAALGVHSRAEAIGRVALSPRRDWDPASF